MGRNLKVPASFIETEGVFITKPCDIANYFNILQGWWTNWEILSVTDDSVSQTFMKDFIIKERQCMFEFHHVEKEYERLRDSVISLWRKISR